MAEDEKDPKTALWLNITKIVLILLGVAGLGGYSYSTKAKSEQGYEVLAGIMNRNVLERIDAMEKRLDSLEVARAGAASQPSRPISIEHLILPGVSKDPYEDIRRGLRSSPVVRAERAPMKSSSITVQQVQAPAPPRRAPARLQDVR